MKLSDVITAHQSASSNERAKHIHGKARLATLINNFPGLTLLFTCGGNEIRLSPSSGGEAELEVGWPKVMPRCTFDTYRVKRGEPPEYIFDVGVFRDNELIGVCEILNKSKTYLPKLAGVLRSGLWLIEVSCRDLDWAERGDRPEGLMHIPCAQVYTP